MFLIIGTIVFLLGSIPLILALKPDGTLSAEQRRKKVSRGISILLADIALIVAFNVYAGIFSDFLWFQQVGYENRFLTVLMTQVGLFLAGATAAFLLLFSLLKPLTNQRRVTTWLTALLVLIALFYGTATSGMWNQVLLFLNRTPSGIEDPIFGLSTSFYLFSLPLLGAIVPWATTLIIVGAVGLPLVGIINAAAAHKEISSNFSSVSYDFVPRVARKLLLLGGIALFVLSLNSLLSVFQLMYSTEGTVVGMGYLDAEYRRYAHFVSIALYVLAGVVLIVSAYSARVRHIFLGLHLSEQVGAIHTSARTAIVPLGFIVILFVLHSIIPSFIMQLKVRPNEITLERPYIQNNIEFTQRGFGIDSGRIERRKYQVGRDIDRRVVNQNSRTLKNIRLWDPRALMDNLREQQEIRLYYEFNDVDIDRYWVEGEYRQLMLSTRELAKEDLDPRSQTWVSRKLKYTHGYGLVMLPVNEFLPQGKPNFFIKNIPAAEQTKSLRITRPQIYYGERTNDHVYVRTKEKEFDYPSGQQNVYTTYEGKGGVSIGSFWRKVLFAWRFSDYRLFFSDYFTNESLVLFRRNIVGRAATIAPFLIYDEDPYAVLTPEGHIKYMCDAYTVSSRYPYSEAYRGSLSHFNGVNYIRNSVKVVIDAYDGSVEFYIVDEDDVLIQTYHKAFPGTFKTLDQMPETIRAHVRYPVDFLTVQAEMYRVYHMDVPDVFYQREDVWQFASERYRAEFQRVEPYYVMLDLPTHAEPEFSLVAAFTPSNKNVINAWMAGLCDFPRYGKLLVFTYPKGIEVLGPRQIEARIDQDTEMSQAMTLWGQRGSQVIRGNLLPIPLFDQDTLYIMYVEPIYLQAENAQLPELKRVAVADQQQVVWAPSFQGALRRILGAQEAIEEAEVPEGADTEPSNLPDNLRQAQNLFEQFRRLSAQGDFAQAGERIQKLGELLNAMNTGQPGDTTSNP